MGSYSQMTIANYPIFSSKNSFFDEIINLLFLPEDFIIEPRRSSLRNELIWGDTYLNDDDDFTFKGYRQKVKVCKERLEIFGMTTENAKNEFPKAKKIAMEEGLYDFPLSKITYKKYLHEISDIIRTNDCNYEQLYTNFRDALIAGELGILGQSLKSHLYSILSVAPEDAIVEYDLSDVINNGWVGESEARKIDFQKILVLTEGRTDVEFIGASIKKLHPHLFSYFHFIDFDEYKVESNASALVKLVTSFSAVNITHPIIVLFDNDTTGLMEMKKLMQVQIPSNIKVLKLPDLKLAKRYPTLGPTGVRRMNINGLACGIEMYLGSDVLIEQQAYIPIHWKAFNEKENKYQGEISDKKLVQEKFRKKLKCEGSSNFEEMELILKSIFTAFQLRGNEEI
ncbi:HEPN/Toprim-associated domain-containing protein [Chryseobacterium sp. YIM B08800]|uniref:HEPN/Toprim-associated domain-containing protein n=1 Tax=Chryseobacterium sp. YIM B08800 TaxID=2984136 RepID=UPI00223F603C|nr:HEPN/Toprim-associated domain-containing protein [Chryseobacterium sp. YIM B08800]